MIQLRNASEPVLRLVRRVAALDARATNAASSPAERVIARRECDALCEEKDLTITQMFVLAPRGRFRISGVSDAVLNENGAPWWRGQLGLLAAMHAGFGASGERPWENDGRSFYLKLVGTRQAVWRARMYYATAETVASSYAPYAPHGHLDEYLCGVSIAIGLAFEAAYARDQMKLDEVSREAMVVYLEKELEPERPQPTTPTRIPEGELDVLTVAQDRFHPVRRGFDTARQDRAGELVLDELLRVRVRPARVVDGE